MKLIWIAAAMSLAAGGVAVAGPKYKPPAASAPAAELVFTKGSASHLMSAGQQAFWLTDQSGCTDFKEAAGIGIGTPKRATLRVAADGRLHLHALTVYLTTASVSMVNGQPSANLDKQVCRGDLSFVPEAGKTYGVIHDSLLGAACELRVTDQATGAPPPTLAAEPACERP